MSKNASYNWEEIKAEYITTDISQRALCKRYGMSQATLVARSKAEGWVEQRKQFKIKTVAKTVEKTVNRESTRLARLMDTTSKAIDVAVRAFGDPEQFNRYLVEKREKYINPVVEVSQDDDYDADAEVSLIAERQWTEEKVFNKVDTKALKDLTAVLKDLTGLMRDFYNLPTYAQAEAQRIAAERLEMDKRKLDDGTDNVIQVVLSDEMQEWAK